MCTQCKPSGKRNKNVCVARVSENSTMPFALVSECLFLKQVSDFDRPGPLQAHFTFLLQVQVDNDTNPCTRDLVQLKHLELIAQNNFRPSSCAKIDTSAF